MRYGKSNRAEAEFNAVNLLQMNSLSPGSDERNAGLSSPSAPAFFDPLIP